MGWFKDVLGGITQGFAGGSFGGSIASGAMGLAGDIFKTGVGNKLYGMPEPKVGGPAGMDRFEYMNKAFPGTTALERLGGSSQGPGNAVQAGKQQAKSQRRTEMHQKLMQTKQIQSNERIAAARQVEDTRRTTQGQTRLEKVEIPQVSIKARLATMQATMNQATVRKINADIRSVKQKVKINKKLFAERWPKLFASMGIENMMVTAISSLHGVPVEKLLKGMELTEDQEVSVHRFIRDANIIKTSTTSTLEAITQMFTGKFGKGSKGHETFNNPSKRNPSTVPSGLNRAKTGSGFHKKKAARR